MREMKTTKRSERDPLSELITLHLRAPERQEAFPALPSHDEPSSRTSLVFRQAIAALDEGHLLGTAPKPVGSRRGSTLRQEEFWPADVASSIAAVSNAFLAFVSESPMNPVWFVATRGAPRPPQEHRLSILENTVTHLLRRVSHLEHTGAFTELDEWSRRPATKEIDNLCAEIGKHLELISNAFSAAFDQPADVTVAPSGPDEDLPITVQLDASQADSVVIEHKRTEGARAQFYDHLAHALPSELLDQTNFEFVFPYATE